MKRLPRAAALLATLTLTACSRSDRPNVASADDPTTTDGDKYRVVLANDHVRVLRYHDEPGDETQLHHHPAFLLYALAPFRRRLTQIDGTQHERVFQAGDVAWMPEQRHLGKNIGDTPTDTLLIEVNTKDRCD